MASEITAVIGAKKYRIASDDNYLQQIGRRFEPGMVRLFGSLVRGHFCVLDVGANIGCTSILFGEIAQRVIAFEPSPSTFRFLEQNVEAAGLRNVALCNYALGAKRGESRLTFSVDNRAGAFVSDTLKTSGGHVTETIRVETLDGVLPALGAPRVDFIKIDVEGFEQHVIEGGLATIRR